MPDAESKYIKMKHKIYEDGSMISEVIERVGMDCNASVKLVEQVGEIEQDERTGPDCDRQEERQI